MLDTAKGGVASARMLHEMRSRNMVPLAIVFNSVNPILVQDAALGGITMMAGFEVDVTAAVPHGAMLELDPAARTLRVLECAAPPPQAQEGGHAASDVGGEHIVHCAGRR